MVKVLVFLFWGFLLGLAFVEITYGFVKRNYLSFYFLILPIKLLFFALVLYGFFLYGGFHGFLLGMSGFLFGFFSMIILRGLKNYGRFKNT